MRIKNWHKFQHFKDRRPPWVKLYRDLLDDIEWHQLDALSAKVLVMLWLIASEDDGQLPNTKTLAFRLRMSEKQTNDAINNLSHWLEQDDINVISQRYQDDLLETETETEREKEKKAKKVACPPDVNEKIWADWIALRKAKKAVVTETVIVGARKEAEKIGWTLEQFLTEWCVRGSQGLKADWIKQPILLNKPDIARVTVPGTNERDPALIKLDQDRKITAPPPPEILAKIKEVLNK
jgi:hypothetical protein